MGRHSTRFQLMHEPRGEHRLYEKSQFQAIYRVQNIEPEARHLIPHFTVITKTVMYFLKDRWNFLNA